MTETFRFRWTPPLNPSRRMSWSVATSFLLFTVAVRIPGGHDIPTLIDLTISVPLSVAVGAVVGTILRSSFIEPPGASR